MNKETNDVQRNEPMAKPVDAFDRKILSALVEDARLTYAEIGKQVSLSAPAVHERVKRLKKSGVLKDMSARLDGPLIGKPFFSFVHVLAEGWGKGQRMMELLEFPEVEEMHSVAGDACIILKVRTANAQAMEKFLAQLYAIPGVRSTKSYVVLSTYLERPIQAEVTQNWPDTHAP